MKNAIATVDFFTTSEAEGTRRLSLVITAPERAPAGEGWQCRVALADVHRPETVVGRDSVEALWHAISLGRSWVAELDSAGRILTRDRAGEIPFELT